MPCSRPSPSRCHSDKELVCNFGDRRHLTTLQITTISLRSIASRLRARNGTPSGRVTAIQYCRLFLAAVTRIASGRLSLAQSLTGRYKERVASLPCSNETFTEGGSGSGIPEDFPSVVGGEPVGRREGDGASVPRPEVALARQPQLKYPKAEIV
jgi:hypothetical protein